MPYSVLCRGEHIGETNLDFPGIGVARCRSGYFEPNALGCELMPHLASKSICMRAFTHRNVSDENGQPLVHPLYVGSSMFADLSQYLQRIQEYELELRDQNGATIPTMELGLQDTERSSETGETDSDTYDSELALQLEREIHGGHEQNHEQREAYRLKEKLSDEMWSEDPEWIREMEALAEMDAEFGGEWITTELDMSSMMAHTENEEQWGMGWNPDLTPLLDLPRYQIHVVLSEQAVFELPTTQKPPIR